MPLGAIAPKFNLSFSTSKVDAALDALVEGGAITALIFNDAKSDDGTYYFVFVDRGRGPIRPVNAKVLHWIDPQTGKDVFASYAKGVAPRHIIVRALAQVREADVAQPSGPLTRETVAKFIDAVAVRAVEEMMKVTPVVTGKLKGSYRIEPAGGAK